MCEHPLAAGWIHGQGRGEQVSGQRVNDLAARFVDHPNSSLPPLRGEVRWGVGGYEPPPPVLHAPIAHADQTLTEVDKS